MTVLDLDRLRARLVEANLGHHADALLDLIEPSVRLVSEPMSERDAAATGTTRLGGEPDLPDTAAWPSFRDMPHSFIAQINLADVSGLAGTNELPDDGLLSFFFGGDQRVWGFDPKDRGGWSVMFTPPGASLHRRRFPASLPEGGRFAARALRPRVELTLRLGSRSTCARSDSAWRRRWPTPTRFLLTITREPCIACEAIRT